MNNHNWNPHPPTPQSINTTIINEAYSVAYQSHMGQTRKYTGLPYITHSVAVAGIVASVVFDMKLSSRYVPKDLIAAALLHDVIEDTNITHEYLINTFGHTIAYLVNHVTDISIKLKNKLSRKVRKEMNKDWLSIANAEVQTIKLADIIDNIQSIAALDPVFAKVYLQENNELLKVLTKGNKILHQSALNILNLVNISS